MPNLSRLQRQALDAFEQGHYDKAERLCHAILEYRSNDFDALHLIGFIRLQRGHLTEAIGFLTKAVQADATSVDAASNLGNAYLAQDRIDEALESYDGALAQNPSHVGARVNRGNALLRVNRLSNALESYERALALMPGHPQILTNRAHVLRRFGRMPEALADLEAALAKAPEFAEAHFEMALARLTLGEFKAGWKEYEWRWKTGAFADKRRAFRQPLWLGAVPLSGKTLLLHAEQGFGDTIQFIRYVPLLAGRGAQLICEVQPELVALLSQFADQFAGVAIVARGQALPHFDLHCPLLSLPLAFGTELAAVPAQVPYLNVPAARVAHWRDRLSQGSPRAGFVWSGSAAHKNDANRSIPLARLERLFAGLPFACFSLQREMRDSDREVLQRLPDLIDLGPGLSDFADAAAVISQMDVIVSVDTAVAHLAGSLGKPVVILLPHAADFRWLRGREDTPWYPTARLLRQPSSGDWDSVLDRLPGELIGLIGAESAR